MPETLEKKHVEVTGANGGHIGTVNHAEGGRTKADSGEGKHKAHHPYIDSSLVAAVEGQKVRLTANAAVVVTTEEEPV
jgi:hypothetical protein